MIKFDFTLDECRQVFNALDNLVIVDQEGKLKYLSPEMYFTVEAYNKKPVPADVVGMHIEDVHYASKITKALDKGKEISTEFYFSSNVTNIARIIPLKRGDEIVGAIDYDLLTDGTMLKKFMERVEDYYNGKNGKQDELEDVTLFERQMPEVYHNFDMTIDECRLVFETVRDLVVVDEKACIKYLSTGIKRIIEKETGIAIPDDPTGMSVDELNFKTRLRTVIETGKAMKDFLAQ